MMQGILFDMQRFCVHDGPGIRTTIFFKGCNLRCFWCHNPESLQPNPEVQYLPMKCIGCGKCAACCPQGCHGMQEGLHGFDRAACQSCFACAAVCPAEALSVVGKAWTVQQVLDIVLRDAPFYRNSGGGITCSGGEPMLQHAFLRELLFQAKAHGLHTAVDTAGNVPFSWFEEVLPYTDLFLYDLKCIDEDGHVRATGAGNRLILENIRQLSNAGAALWVRIPVIPGVNDTADNMDRAAQLLQPLKGVRLVELLTFHRLGGGKYESIGRSFAAMDLQPLSKEEMQGLSRPFGDIGIPVKVS